MSRQTYIVEIGFQGMMCQTITAEDSESAKAQAVEALKSLPIGRLHVDSVDAWTDGDEVQTIHET